MKIIKRLSIDDQPYEVIDDDIRLKLKRPGTASLNVKAKKPVTGLVIVDIGWSETKLRRFFMGYVVKSTTISPNEQLVFCRELTAVLFRDQFMGLRHATVSDVLRQLAKGRPLQFVTPNASYIKHQSPYFHHTGGGYHALDAIGPVYKIPNYIWQQQGDGKIYVGSWDDSRWPSRNITIPDKYFTRHLTQGCAEMAMVPGMRPGVLFNRGIVTAVQLKKENMVITWKSKSSAFS